MSERSGRRGSMGLAPSTMDRRDRGEVEGRRIGASRRPNSGSRSRCRDGCRIATIARIAAGSRVDVDVPNRRPVGRRRPGSACSVLRPSVGIARSRRRLAIGRGRSGGWECVGVVLVVLGVALVVAAWGTARAVDSLAVPLEPRAGQGPDRLRIARRGQAAALRVGGAVARRGRGRSSSSGPASKPSAAPRPPRRPGRGCRPTRPVRRPRGHAPRPAPAEARPVRRGRGTPAHRHAGPGPHAIEARETLVHLFKLEGRFDELRTLVQDALGHLPRPVRPAPATGESRLDQPGADREDLARPGDRGRERTGRRPDLAGPGQPRHPHGRVRRGPGAGSTTAWSGGRMTRRSGRAGSTWPWRPATWSGRGGPWSASRPTASRRRKFWPSRPGSPRDPATASGSARRWRSCSNGHPAGSRPWSDWPSSSCWPGGPTAPRSSGRGRRSWTGPRSITRSSSRNRVRRPFTSPRRRHAWRRCWAGPSRPAPSGRWSSSGSPGDREASRGPGPTGPGQAEPPPGRPSPDSSPSSARSPARPHPQDRRRLRSPTFTDDAEAVGPAVHVQNGATPERQIPETMSGGVGLLDYDGDGWLDVYLVQGGVFPPDPGSAHGPNRGDRLFRNRGDGTFEDATAAAGSPVRRGLRPRGRGRRLRQRRPSRPLRHPLARLCPLSQPRATGRFGT